MACGPDDDQGGPSPDGGNEADSDSGAWDVDDTTGEPTDNPDVAGDEVSEDPDQGDDPTPDCDQLWADLRTVAAASATRGLVVGVDTPTCGRWSAAVGTAEPGVQLETGRLLRIGSVTKTYTAATILTLVANGQVALDDTIDRFVDGVPSGEAMTMRHLLNHSSGLFDIIEDEAFMEAALANPDRPITPQELVAAAIAHEPLFEPGERAQYSNTNYHLLGVVIQHVTGQTAAEAIDDRVLTPLALQNTTLEGVEPLPEPLVPGFSPAGQDITGVLHPTLRWTAGAMVTSIEELLAWAMSLYRGELLGDTHALMLSEPVEAGPVHFGLGVVIRTVPEVGPVHGHGGVVPGYRATILYVPGHDVAIAVIANQADTDAVAIADGLARTTAAFLTR